MMNIARLPSLIHLAVGAALLCCQAAQAQAINKCVIDGRLVFQASPCPLKSVDSVAGAPVALATAVPAGPRKKTLADVLRERDGDIRSQPAPRQPQLDGANVLRSRMGAS